MECMTPETLADVALPAVPLTIEGASVLHQMMRIRWTAWRALTHAERADILHEAELTLAGIEEYRDGRQSALYSLIGHKGDLLFVHFRCSFEELASTEKTI